MINLSKTAAEVTTELAHELKQGEKIESTYYSVCASCMLPGQAWAKTIGRAAKLPDAEMIERNVAVEWPHGIVRARQLNITFVVALSCRVDSNQTAHRTVRIRAFERTVR